MERQNRSSYAKVMVVLRTHSELEDKMVRKWEIFAAAAINWWKRWEETHKLDSNKTSTRTQTQHYGLWNWNMQRLRRGWVVGHENNMALDSKLKVDVHLKVCLKLWLRLEEKRCDPILRKVLVTIDLVETRHKSIHLANNTIRYPAILFIFFWYFSFTLEHSRSNHWKFELKQVKDVACGIFWRLQKIWKKL